MLTQVYFTELKVADQDRALKFYTEKIGCTVHTDAPYMNGLRWIMLKVPGPGETLIHFDRRANEERDKTPSLVLLSDDIETDYKALSGTGVECLEPPQAAPWDPDQIFFLRFDTEGNQILIQTPAGGA